MSSRAALSLLAVAVLGAGVWMVLQDPPGGDARAPTGAGLAPGDDARPAQLAPLVGGGAPDPGRAAARDEPASATGARPRPDPLVGPRRLRARLVDRSGDALGGVLVRLAPPRGADRRPLDEPREARTDGEGRLDAGEVRPAAQGAWSLFAVLDGGLGPPDPSSPRPTPLAPSAPDAPLVDVVLGTGPRVVVSTSLPRDLAPSDLLVELHCTPSVLSSQMGGLGGLALLRETDGVLWAWIPAITNSVRDPGARARLLSIDGLWASDWEDLTPVGVAGAPRLVENEDEFFISPTLEPRAVLVVAGPDGAPAPDDLHAYPADLPEELRRPAWPERVQGGRMRFRWLEPTRWTLRQLSVGSQVIDPTVAVVFTPAGRTTEHALRLIPASPGDRR